MEALITNHQDCRRNPLPDNSSVCHWDWLIADVYCPFVLNPVKMRSCCRERKNWFGFQTGYWHGAENVLQVSITLAKFIACTFYLFLQPTSVIPSSAQHQTDELVSSLRRRGDIEAWKYDLGQQEAAELLAWGEPNACARTWRSHERPFHVEMKKKGGGGVAHCL